MRTKITKPPKLAQRLLGYFCSDAWIDEVLGDLEEQFTDSLKRKNRLYANLLYWWQVIRLLRPHIIKRKHRSARIMMTRNHLKISYRNLSKNKIYSAINILGLAVGIASVMLIGIYVNYETSYDKFFDDSDRISRIALNRIYPGRVKTFGTSSIMLAPTLKNNYPQVEEATRLHRLFFNNEIQVTLEENNEVFNETRYLFADSSFFKVFSHEFVLGNPETALDDANAIVLTESTALKYFGTTDVLNKTINANGGPLQVSAVIKDVPANSHIHFDLLGSTFSLNFLNNAITQDSWVNPWVYTYVKLKQGVDPVAFETELPELVETYGGANIAQQSGSDWKAKGHSFDYFLQPIESIHLTSKLDVEVEPNSDIAYVYIISIIAIIILTISSINFINLSIARSTERAKEVGIRKVMGSQRSALISQFLTESIFVCFLSSIISIGIVYLSIPKFNDILGTFLSFNSIIQPIALIALLIFTIVVGIVSGFYPAMVISALQPSSVLKGSYKNSNKGVWLRNSLIITQFIISIFMISGSIIVSQQMDYLVNKELGFNKENVLVLRQSGRTGTNYNAFFNEISEISAVQSIGKTTAVPGDFLGSAVYQVSNPNIEDVRVNTVTTDRTYFETMEFEISMGRGFDANFNDSLSIVINEATVRSMGIEDPIGLKFSGNNSPNGPGPEFTIVGVVKDFNFYSLHSEVSPIVMFYGGNNFNSNIITIRIGDSSLDQTLNTVKEKWAEFSEQPIKYSFLELELASQYKSDQASTSIFDIFTYIAIIMSCTGLFGLATYVVNQRSKEMSIRKVLGASLPHIITSFSKEFLVLIGIAFLIGAPVAYFALKEWLVNFAYHVNIGVGGFLLAGGITLALVFITVSYQAIKVAMVNPTKTLRSE
jgi:putative ABC transport system permease protein